jgi:subtilisin inhibitor-like
MRALALACLALLAVTLAAAAPGAPAGNTALRIAYYEDGREPETRVVFTLRCDPVRGNHPKRTLACRQLRRLGWQTLRPVPPDVACTEIYGGPAVVFVTGVVEGRPVWAKLRRDNGCEIDRWDRNGFLVPVALR